LLHELRLLLGTLQRVTVALAWLMVGFALLLVVFGIILTDGAVTYCYQVGDSTTNELRASFGNLWLSLYTLCQVGSGGILWYDVAELLNVLGVSYIFAFHVYAVVCCSAVKCLVVAVFVDAFRERVRNTQEVMPRSALDEKRHFVEAFESALRTLDSSSSGTLQIPELERCLDSLIDASGPLSVYFQALGLNADHLRTLFNVLDAEQTGEVSIDGFASACVYLSSRARAGDVVLLQYEVGVLRGMVERVGEFLGDMAAR
jgi:hypothetical protein